jgi:diaminopimelate epimerase
MTEHEMTPADPHRPPLHLSKHHGAGNDFLVLLDLDDRLAPGPAAVRALCDRRFGVGADGFIRIVAGSEGADLTMDLTNADGGTAEMSGNGMRCLAQAAVRARLVQPPQFTVATPGGVRVVEYRVAEGDGPDWASVDMGVAHLGREKATGGVGDRARLVDVGNPHLVVMVEDPAGTEVAALGSALQGEFADGINVEFIAVGPAPDSLVLRVWERGVGETLACGTGSVAAAAAAHGWGLVGTTVEVHNPGGTLAVELRADGAVLSGPVVLVADIDVPAGRWAGTGLEPDEPGAPTEALATVAGRRR